MEETSPVPSAPVVKPRRWPSGLLVGFLTAIVALFAVVPLAEWAMEMHHVSNMEGGRGFAMVGCWMPLALLVGFSTGFIVGLTTAGSGFVGYLKRQGIALLALAILFALTSGIAYGTVDHPPKLDGQRLALEIEARVPAKGRSIEELDKAGFRIALVVSASDRSYSDLRWSGAMAENDFIMVPAWATLNSRNAGRDIVVGIKDENDQLFTVVLPPSPRKIEETWTEWIAPRQRYNGSKPAPEDQYSVRYRVRFAAEYSPTPSPRQTPEPTAAPEDSPDPEPEASP